MLLQPDSPDKPARTNLGFPQTTEKFRGFLLEIDGALEARLDVEVFPYIQFPCRIDDPPSHLVLDHR